MTPRNLMLLAAAGSFALLAGAFVFQALGYAPCKMCIWQRWPHGVAIGAGVAVLATGAWAIWALIGGISALVTAGIGVYHTGVERDWWEGPTGCTGGGLSMDGLSGGDLLDLGAPTGVVMCDEVTWALFGISMASWNALISFGLALLWFYALKRKQPVS